MSGITGILDLAGRSGGEAPSAVATRAANQLLSGSSHPARVWDDPKAGVALAYRGRPFAQERDPQPIESVCGRYILVLAGRLYNGRELTPFGSDSSERGSDVAAFLAGARRWGVRAAVKRLSGMFAFALWDRAERTLYLGRDRMGEKALYYGWIGEWFVFGSELRVVHGDHSARLEIDRGSLALLLRYTFIPAPHSIYRGVFKLPPATILTLNTELPGSRPSPEPYWLLAEVALERAARPFSGTDGDAAREMEDLLRKAIERRTEGCSPGAFLSGGVDSSLVAALMQANSSKPVPTFTIGFNDASCDEAPYARAVAQHLGTDHHEFYLDDDDLLSVIPGLPETYDEPFADSSQIPSLILARMARESVEVVLAGDGGDALLGEYPTYYRFWEMWDRRARIPAPLRHVLAVVSSTLHALTPNHRAPLLAPVLDGFGITDPCRAPLLELTRILTAPSREQLVLGLISHWHRPCSVVLHAYEPPTAWTTPQCWTSLAQLTDRLVQLDATTLLPGVLTKTERAATAADLDVRMPYLDPAPIEFAWRLSIPLKVRPGRSKWLLREVACKFLPRDLVDRKKMGFNVSLGRLFRGALRPWIEELIDERRLRREGYFRPGPIRRRWKQHLDGERDWWEEPLWAVLMFQAWLGKR